MNTYRWLNSLSQQFLEQDYLLPGQTVDERVDVICNAAGRILNDDTFAARFKDYFQRGWYSFSTPVWTNFGNERGLPISCYGSFIDDSINSILDAHAEVGIMTKLGGGTSGYFGELRGRGSDVRNNGKTSGAVHFMSMFENVINIISQGNTRRGNFAAYLPIEHPDIKEFLEIRSEGNLIQNLFFGVTITNKWLNEMKDGDIEKRKLWAKVLETRINTGLPYIMFTDNVNDNTVEVYKDKNMKITHSNLCSEISLSNSSDESFVCDLSSMNIAYYDEWKGTDAVKLMTYFLDAVMTEFIEKASAEKHMVRAVNFARKQRALGIGWLGWHSYLQKKMIPFESFEAKKLNTQVAKFIHDEAYKASAELAKEFGEPELLQGYGRRNVTLLAIAPTKSSAFILGQVSEGIEPFRSNYYIKDTAKGKFTLKNPALEQLLEEKGKNIPSVWESILQKSGSVQHLDFLSENEKDVFKTFSEISMKEVVIQAAARQKYIDQSQSLNLLIHPMTPVKDVNALMLFAWEQGVKTLYYQYSINASQELSRNLLECKSCSA